MTAATPYSSRFLLRRFHAHVGDGLYPDMLRPGRALQVGMADVAAADDAYVDACHRACQAPMWLMKA